MIKPLALKLGYPKHECVPFIFIVDDTAFNIIPVKHMIQDKHGIKCVTAENGQEAVNMYQAWFDLPCKCQYRVPSLIIMDIGMPVMDGKEASKIILNILKKSATPDITKIVALTSFTN